MNLPPSTTPMPTVILPVSMTPPSSVGISSLPVERVGAQTIARLALRVRRDDEQGLEGAVDGRGEGEVAVAVGLHETVAEADLVDVEVLVRDGERDDLGRARGGDRRLGDGGVASRGGRFRAPGRRERGQGRECENGDAGEAGGADGAETGEAISVHVLLLPPKPSMREVGIEPGQPCDHQSREPLRPRRRARIVPRRAHRRARFRRFLRADSRPSRSAPSACAIASRAESAGSTPRSPPRRCGSRSRSSAPATRPRPSRSPTISQGNRMMLDRTVLGPAAIARVSDDFHQQGEVARFAMGGRSSRRRGAGPRSTSTYACGDLELDAAVDEGDGPAGHHRDRAARRRARQRDREARAARGPRPRARGAARGRARRAGPPDTTTRTASCPATRSGAGRSRSAERRAESPSASTWCRASSARPSAPRSSATEVFPIAEPRFEFDVREPMKPWRLVGDGHRPRVPAGRGARAEHEPPRREVALRPAGRHVPRDAPGGGPGRRRRGAAGRRRGPGRPLVGLCFRPGRRPARPVRRRSRAR